MANCAITSNLTIRGIAVNRRKLQNRFVAVLFCTFVTIAIGGVAEEKDNKRFSDNKTARHATATIEDSFQDALRKIPWNSLAPTTKARIKTVVATPSIFRRLPQQSVYTDSEIYQYLLEHPDIVVGFWEKLGVTQISLRELSEDRFLMKETGGTTAVAEVLYRTRDLCIVHAKGQYRGPLLAKPIDGEAVLVLRSRFLRDDDNEPYVICQLDSFVRLDGVGADLIAKLLSNVLGKIADSNFEQTIGFVGNVSDAATNNTGKVKDLSSKMRNVRNDVRDDFSDVVDRVASRGAKRGPRVYPDRVFPEYVELPIPMSHTTEESCPLSSYSIPMPIISRQTQSVSQTTNVPETSEHEEKSAEEKSIAPPTIQEAELPIPIGVSTLGDGPVEPPKNRVIFRKPNVSTTEPDA